MKILFFICFFSYIFSSCSTEQVNSKEPIGPEHPTNIDTIKDQPNCIPMTHILVCCRKAGNEGTIKFKIGNQWITDHDYKNIEHAKSILSSIKAAGINDIIIDMSNPSQWESNPGSWPGCAPNEGAFWETNYKSIISTVEKACTELDMKFIMLIGNPAKHTLSYWNGIAKRIWENWANKSIYRKYGFGDNRPMLIVFYMGEAFWKLYNAAPEKEKNYLSKFRIGTCQVNDAMNFVESDGWGYRHKSSSSDGKVRFVCPNEGVAPAEWRHSTLQQWKEKVEWASKATEYCILGSYDDTNDAIFWGIADTKDCNNPKKYYPNNENPDDYYNVVKEYFSSK